MQVTGIVCVPSLVGSDASAATPGRTWCQCLLVVCASEKGHFLVLVIASCHMSHCNRSRRTQAFLHISHGCHIFTFQKLSPIDAHDTETNNAYLPHADGSVCLGAGAA